MTDGDLRLLKMLADGLPRKQMAGQLGVGEEAVKSRLRRLYGELGVNNAPAAVWQGVCRGLLVPPPPGQATEDEARPEV